MSISIKTITTVSTLNHKGVKELERSLIVHGYDYLIIQDNNINWNWGGMGNIYKWCRSPEAENYTHFLYTDGFDTVALGAISEIIDRYINHKAILYSAEKGCFPRADWADLHADSSRWRFLNHGQFLAPIDAFIELYKECIDLPLTCQEWAMERFLFSGDQRFALDTNCEIFQSVAFRGDDEFSIKGKRIRNNITGTMPVLAHGNGHTDIRWIYDLCRKA